MLAWIDDFDLHAETEDKLFSIPFCFMDISEERNLVVSITKSTFFAKEIVWCCRILAAKGTRLHLSSYEAMVHANPPIAGSELSLYANCRNWMREVFPRYDDQTAPFRDTL